MKKKEKKLLESVNKTHIKKERILTQSDFKYCPQCGYQTFFYSSKCCACGYCFYCSN